MASGEGAGIHRLVIDDVWICSEVKMDGGKTEVSTLIYLGMLAVVSTAMFTRSRRPDCASRESCLAAVSLSARFYFIPLIRPQLPRFPHHIFHLGQEIMFE